MRPCKDKETFKDCKPGEYLVWYWSSGLGPSEPPLILETQVEACCFITKGETIWLKLNKGHKPKWQNWIRYHKGEEPSA